MAKVEEGDFKSQISNLKFKISDTGQGIAPEEMDQLFEAFGQTEAGRQVQEGTGLGLPISRKFVQLMGGDIMVDSELGQGTSFTFTIQMRVVEKTGIMESRQPLRRVIALESGQPCYRMLIADDAPDNRKLLVKLFTPLGFELQEAANGQEAIDIWEQWEPRLIWMDRRMPLINGYDATKRIREAESRKQKAEGRRQKAITAIIAMTASSFEEERKTALAAGCDDFLRKPFREEDVFELIHKHLGVRYVYEESEEQGARGERQRVEDVFTPEALAALPPKFLEKLEHAMVTADIGRIATLIHETRHYDSALADAVARLADDFEYAKMLNVIQGAKKVSDYE